MATIMKFLSRRTADDDKAATFHEARTQGAASKHPLHMQDVVAFERLNAFASIWDCKLGIVPMATQPPSKPDWIEPQSPPEAPPTPAQPVEPYPDEAEPLSPDFDQPGQSPEELPDFT